MMPIASINMQEFKLNNKQMNYLEAMIDAMIDCRERGELNCDEIIVVAKTFLKFTEEARKICPGCNPKVTLEEQSSLSE